MSRTFTKNIWKQSTEAALPMQTEEHKVTSTSGK